MTSVNLAEKLELAKSLNLKRQISQLEYNAGMFDLKFKPISWDKVNKRLSFERWKLSKVPCICASLMIIMATILFLEIKQPILMLFSHIPVIGLIVLQSRQTTRVLWSWVDDFHEELPFGAMLALKEAREKGILHHRVHYPIWTDLFSESMESKADDPIITGFRADGKGMVEIYAWNENDVYEK